MEYDNDYKMYELKKKESQIKKALQKTQDVKNNNQTDLLYTSIEEDADAVIETKSKVVNTESLALERKSLPFRTKTFGYQS